MGSLVFEILQVYKEAQELKSATVMRSEDSSVGACKIRTNPCETAQGSNVREEFLRHFAVAGLHAEAIGKSKMLQSYKTIEVVLRIPLGTRDGMTIDNEGLEKGFVDG